MRTYMPTPQQNEARERNFKYHAPDLGLEQPTKDEDIRTAGKKLAELLDTHCPPSRELSLAMTNLEQALFWANASIARHERREADAPAAAGS